jgi:WD40-like Beta Propeller Repeat
MCGVAGCRCRSIRRTALALVTVVLVAGCDSARRPDRAGLAFARWTSPTESSVWVARADGSHAWRIAAEAFEGKLSPNGRWLAYAVARNDGYPDVFVRKVSAGKSRYLGRAAEYEWSSDSTRVFLTKRTALLLVDVTSGRRRELAHGDVWGASFAPEGTQLAYVRANGKAGHEYRGDIFVIRLSDGQVTRLTHDGHSDMPVWGRGWIAYRHYYFSGDWSMGRLWLMRTDGSGKQMLARDDERVTHAAMGLDPIQFSADGKRLLACAAFEFSCPPVVFTIPGGKRYRLRIQRLTHRQESAYSQSLSADGRRLLVDVGPFDGDQGHRVYVVPVGGGIPRLLLADGNYASWAH